MLQSGAARQQEEREELVRKQKRSDTNSFSVIQSFKVDQFLLGKIQTLILV
jgi:hypothetical protein